MMLFIIISLIIHITIKLHDVVKTQNRLFISMVLPKVKKTVKKGITRMGVNGGMFCLRFRRQFFCRPKFAKLMKKC